MSVLAERAARIRERMMAACGRAGRASSDVTCIAVSKFHPAEAIREAVAAGLTAFGENYAQELSEKQAQLADVAALQWHFIGSLQRNKAKLIAGQVALVHSVDSFGLAQTLGQRAAALGVTQPILIAVNLGGEASKSGITAGALPTLLGEVRQVSNVRVDGLMTMPPPADVPEANRGYFRQLRALRDANASATLPLATLSMGMSDDFEVAIEEGATHIRVGTAIFGARQGLAPRATR